MMAVCVYVCINEGAYGDLWDYTGMELRAIFLLPNPILIYRDLRLEMDTELDCS